MDKEHKMMRWITVDDYFGQFAEHPDLNDVINANAHSLISAVNKLMDKAFTDDIDFYVNPSTGCHVAGSEFGGFRPQSCPQGSPNSSHKTGQGVDIFDGYVVDGGKFAKWCFQNQDELAKHNLYMEHPSATIGKTSCWCHLSTRAPGSGKRVFYP